MKIFKTKVEEVIDAEKMFNITFRGGVVITVKDNPLLEIYTNQNNSGE